MNLATWREFLAILESNTGIAQTYETLLSSLHLAEKTRPAGPLKSLMVTSTQPGEGKTTVCVGMALTMALGGEKVLLVDADARKPRLHEIFELSYRRGFTDLLADAPQVELGDVVKKVTLRERHAVLHIVPSGTLRPVFSNPLDSTLLEEFVVTAGREYDVVLFDSPPVLAVSDACFLAPVVSGVIFVIGTGTVQEREARLAKERVQRAGGHLLGFVMNRFDGSDGYHPYGAYYDPSV